MKTNIYKVGVLALTLLFAGCYDLNDLSHDPYKIEDDSTSGKEDKPIEDKTDYADINIDDYVSSADSAACKEDINGVPGIFREYLYQGYYSQYQRATNLTHDVYSGYGA